MATSLLDRLKSSGASLGTSAVLHLLVLAALSAITWIVVTARDTERDVTLAEPEVLASGTEPGKGEAGSRSGASGQPDAPHQAAAAVIQPALPIPRALDASVAALLKPPPPADLPAPPRPSSGRLVTALAAATDLGGVGRGTGPLAGTSPGFGKEIAALRSRGLDIVLAIDATNSMAPYIEQGKRRLQQVVDVVTHLVPKARFGVVAYKDYGDEYGVDAVRSMKITTDYRAVRAFVDGISAGGGGDEPEPINAALAVATDGKAMGWRPSARRVLILVGDSSIHPSGRKEAFASASAFARNKWSTINVIDVGGTGAQGVRRSKAHPDLLQIAQAGGGKAFLLEDKDAFWRHMIISIFGRRYEQDVNTIIRMVAEKKK